VINPLGVERFPEFFQALHNLEPFPWQKALAARVLSGEGWPRLLPIPTGAGKTALMDIAVFALASEAGVSASGRRSPLRIFFVVDRRVVVDEAHQRALGIARALEAAMARGDSPSTYSWKMRRTMAASVSLMVRRPWRSPSRTTSYP
jgi:CRISPR-associated endonuclease/helicase Cas3